MKPTLILSLLLMVPQAYTASPSMDLLFQELKDKNNEIKASDLKVEFQNQNLVGSKSRLYPTLSLSLSANDSKTEDLDSTSSNSVDSGVNSGDQLGSQSSTQLSNISSVNKGWLSQLSMGYFIFTNYAISEDIKKSQNSLLSAELSSAETYDQKKSQLLQLLLEWQTLYEIKKPIIEASQLIQKVKSFSQKKAKLLYSRKDRAQLEEKSTTVEYHKIKVLEGIQLVESALITVLPTLNKEKLKVLPKIKINYPIPTQSEIKTKYLKQSRSLKKSLLDIEASKGYLKTSQWSNRSWSPTIYWSASYSYSGNYYSETRDNGWSTALLFSFNLFDGHYSRAREEQAAVSVKASEIKKEFETDHKILFLKHQRMTSVVSKAEYKMKKAIATKKKLRFLDLKRKYKQGIGSQLELSLGSLDFVKAQLEALNSLKEYQKSLLNISVELNEFNKVKVHEI